MKKLLFILFILIIGCNQAEPERVWRATVTDTSRVERSSIVTYLESDTFHYTMEWDTIYISDMFVTQEQWDTLISELTYQSNQIAVLEQELLLLNTMYLNVATGTLSNAELIEQLYIIIHDLVHLNDTEIDSTLLIKVYV